MTCFFLYQQNSSDRNVQASISEEAFLQSKLVDIKSNNLSLIDDSHLVLSIANKSERDFQAVMTALLEVGDKCGSITDADESTESESIQLIDSIEKKFGDLNSYEDSLKKKNNQLKKNISLLTTKISEKNNSDRKRVVFRSDNNIKSQISSTSQFSQKPKNHSLAESNNVNNKSSSSNSAFSSNDSRNKDVPFVPPPASNISFGPKKLINLTPTKENTSTQNQNPLNQQSNISPFSPISTPPAKGAFTMPSFSKANPPANSLTTNSLTTNALTTNALTKNALTTNPLTTNPLTTNPLTTNPLTTNPLTANALTTNPLTTNPLTTNAFTINKFTTNPINSTNNNSTLTGNSGNLFSSANPFAGSGGLSSNQPSTIQAQSTLFGSLSSTSNTAFGTQFGSQGSTDPKSNLLNSQSQPTQKNTPFGSFGSPSSSMNATAAMKLNSPGNNNPFNIATSSQNNAKSAESPAATSNASSNLSSTAPSLAAASNFANISAPNKFSSTFGSNSTPNSAFNLQSPLPFSLNPGTPPNNISIVPSTTFGSSKKQ